MPQPYLVDTPAPANYLRRMEGSIQHIRGIPRLVYVTRQLFLHSPDNIRLVSTPEGFPITINTDDYSNVMNFYFPCSPELRTLLIDLLNPGDVCIDFGANVGLLSVTMADAVGSKGLVIAVDPNPDNIYLLQNTVQRCSITNIIAVQVGVAGEDRTAYFAIPHGVTSVSGDLRPDREDGLKVRLVTVDSLLREAAPNQTVNFVKYDVEGAEAELIESLQGIFERGERPILLVEFHPKKIALWNRNTQAIREKLWAFGYDERRIEIAEGHYRLRKDKQPLETNANILFIQSNQLTVRSKLNVKWTDDV